MSEKLFIAPPKLKDIIGPEIADTILPITPKIIKVISFFPLKWYSNLKIEGSFLVVGEI